MHDKKWIVYYFVIISIIPAFAVLNYFVDPYGMFFKREFISQTGKMRLVKAIKIKEVKPRSIILGTSRAEVGFDPNHAYLKQPSYNASNSGASMYEEKLYFKWALEQGRLEQVLLVADFRMFNFFTQKSIPDLESYFDPKINKYKLLFTFDALKDSVNTIFSNEILDTKYLSNGQQNPLPTHTENLRDFIDSGDRTYYTDYPVDYRYRDTGEKSFLDFEELLKLCYENQIELVIIFGPSHVRQWESLNYHLGISHWFKWKKDVVLSVSNIANKFNRMPFDVFDFSVYHELTAEEIPRDKNLNMKFFRDSSHYRNRLGLIVLDRISGNSPFKDFGFTLNVNNIDKHILRQKMNREQYINIKDHQLKIFKSLKNL